MPTFLRNIQLCACVALLASLPSAVAHGHDEDMGMDMPVARPTIAPAPQTTNAAPESYFQYGEHSGLLFGHIFLMIISWVFVLPIGVMFSIAQSRYTFLSQILFAALNGAGVLLATIYNAQTPDLYPNNAHHKLGWLLTWVVTAQIMLGVITTYARRHSSGRKSAEIPFIPVSTANMEEHQRRENLNVADTYRFSNDSGQGTEPKTESLRSQSISSTSNESNHHMADVRLDHADEPHDEESFDLLHGSRIDKFLVKKVPGILSSRVLKFFQFIYNLVDRVILILGFVAISTGGVTYGGLFMGSTIFSGLAHFIKGGVFFWYGILTLGRWAGCFAEIGWSWNVKPFKSNKPSAEFVESLLIFIYGSTNIFLEHLAAWGSEWTPEDFEHISITVMFIGGGLCGMFIESTRLRGLLNAGVEQSKSRLSYRSAQHDSMEPPRSYKSSMNPIPALIVLLLGLMMSSHHQETMIATMIHKQWGNLLVGAAFSRAATYVIFYLAPPTSIFPGRPPSELITAFCLMAGGTIFMASARDCVTAMIAHNVDVMFVFTVTMGLITFLMAWIILVIAIKGWAVRKEARKEAGAFAYSAMA